MYIAGVDIGTTGTKAMIYGEDGKRISQAYKGYKLSTGANGFVEQDADDWLNAAAFAVRRCAVAIKGEIKAIAFSAQGASMAPVNSKGDPLSPAITWMDTRSEREARVLETGFGGDKFYLKTGWPLNPSLNASKILWLKNNAPSVFKETAQYLTTLDYINMKLTGEAVIDPTSAAITQLMNVTEADWDCEILDMLGISGDKLPDIRPSGRVIGALTREAAELFGLPEGTPVVNGAHDQYCSALGAGAVQNGDTVLTAGTAWALLAITSKPYFDCDTHIAVGPHVAPGLWGALSTAPTAGAAMEWLREKACFRGGDISFREIDDIIKARPYHGNSLLFYPHFGGRGFPDNNLGLRASILGLTLNDDAYAVAQSAMEGAAFEIRFFIEAYRNMGIEINSLRMMGGAAKSELWTDIVAHTAGVPLIRLKEPDTACVGAAMLAGAGAGVFDGLAGALSKMGADGDIWPICDERQAYYTEKYGRYKWGLKQLENFYTSAKE